MQDISNLNTSKALSPESRSHMHNTNKDLSNALIVTRIPKFLRSLYEILYAEDTSIIAWAMNGRYFEIFDIKRLELEILPKYFKHSKFASFQRQLNNFGFRKWTKTQSNVCTFSHRFYVQQHPDDLMELIMKNAELIAIKRHRKSSLPRLKSSSNLQCRKRRASNASMTDVYQPNNDTLLNEKMISSQRIMDMKPSHMTCPTILCTNTQTEANNETWNLIPLDVMKSDVSRGDPVGHDSPTTISDTAEFIDLYPPELLNEILQSAADFMEDNSANIVSTCPHQTHVPHGNMVVPPTTYTSMYAPVWQHESIYAGLSYKHREPYLNARPEMQLWST